MKYYKNDIAGIYYEEELGEYIHKLCNVINEYPEAVNPCRGISEEAKNVFRKEGFVLYSTIKKTTLLYHEHADCYFKILNPLTIKSRVTYFLFDKAKNIYNNSEYLFKHDVNIARVEAYGTLLIRNSPFFVMKRVRGELLYNIILKRMPFDQDIFFKVIDEIVKVHNLGYWFGDLHLSDFFIDNNEVSGIIDIDGFRKNPGRLKKNLAKDLAGLIHPALPLSENKRKEFFMYYLDKMGIKNTDKFIKQVEYYMERRWKATTNIISSM